MTILEQAIRKAFDNCWRPVGINPDHPAVVFSLALEGVDKGYIFTHDFAKALWGEETIYVSLAGQYESDVPLWQYHLQQMVISDNPIQYLGEHLKMASSRSIPHKGAVVIYCTYCKTPTHADTSCPYQLKENK